MATKEDRSLSSGMSLPRWMKTKMNDKLDIETTVFSPTELDDSFMFYYRNNSRNANPAPTSTLTSTLNDGSQAAPANVSSRPDFSKHTPFCQKFLQNSVDTTAAQHVKFPSATKTKSSGTDDGFKGEAARCGTSVIRVAHQMVAGKVIRGFNIQTQNECGGDLPPDGFNPSLRRGSKSLPASPLTSPGTSPKTKRRHNKYFTGPYVDNENHHGNWILSNLLAKRQTLSQSVGHIAEEKGGDVMKGASSEDHVDAGSKKSSLILGKPSELREMNFLFPTSM